MHAKVFQITKQRVDEENILNENTLTQGDGSDYDYCSNISEEERAEMIEALANDILPKGMFSMAGDDELVFQGGADEWKKSWAEEIQDKAKNVTAENVTDWIGAAYQLEKAIKNPLHTDSHFYLSEDSCQSYAETSNELMRFVCSLKEGTHLFIGGVIDFHF